MRKLVVTFVVSLLLLGCSVYQQEKAEETTPLEVTHDLADSQQDSALALLNEINNNDYTVDHPYLKVDPYGINPLSFLLAFNSNGTTNYTITVHSNVSDDANLSYEFGANDQIIAALTGLNVDGETLISIHGDDDTYFEYMLSSNPIPEDAFANVEVVLNEKNLPNNHLIFTTPSASGYVSAYDTNGQLRFILTQTFTWDTNVNSDNELLISNETLLDLPYYFSGFYTIDLTGHVSSQYVLPGGYHHDVDQLENGNYLVASDDLNRDTVEDVVVEIDKETGEIVKTFDLTTILDPNTGKSINWTSSDWFHNNSVEYDPIDNTLVVSGRHQDIVAIIDYDSQQLVGLVGDPSGWDESFLPYFYTPIGDDFEYQWAQHAATYNSNHDLMLFDNGIYRSKDKTNTVEAIDNYSRFVIYRLDQENKTIEQVYQYGKERGYQYYSPYICDVDEIESDQYLITSGGISYKDGEINNLPGPLTSYDVMEAYITVLDNQEATFELKINSNIYRSELIDVNSIRFNGFDYSLKGNLGHTQSQVNDIVRLDSALDRSEADALEFSLSKDNTRVVFEGSIGVKDTLSLVVDNGDQINEFAIQNEKEVGMCVSIFNSDDENNHLIKSISLMDLNENAHFYYLYNDVLYDSGYTLN